MNSASLIWDGSPVPMQLPITCSTNSEEGRAWKYLLVKWHQVEKDAKKGKMMSPQLNIQQGQRFCLCTLGMHTWCRPGYTRTYDIYVHMPTRYMSILTVTSYSNKSGLASNNLLRSNQNVYSSNRWWSYDIDKTTVNKSFWKSTNPNKSLVHKTKLLNTTGTVKQDWSGGSPIYSRWDRNCTWKEK